MICFHFLFYSEPVTTYDMTYISVFNVSYIQTRSKSFSHFDSLQFFIELHSETRYSIFDLA